MTINIAKCENKEWKSAFITSSNIITFSINQQPSRPNLKNTLFVFGDLLIQIFYCSEKDLIIHNNQADQKLLQIYPLTGVKLTWPPAKLLSNFEVAALADVISTLSRSPNVRWVPE